METARWVIGFSFFVLCNFFLSIYDVFDETLEETIEEMREFFMYPLIKFFLFHPQGSLVYGLLFFGTPVLVVMFLLVPLFLGVVLLAHGMMEIGTVCIFVGGAGAFFSHAFSRTLREVTGRIWDAKIREMVQRDIALRYLEEREVRFVLMADDGYASW